MQRKKTESMDPGPSYSNYLNSWLYVALPAYILFGKGQPGFVRSQTAGPAIAFAGI